MDSASGRISRRTMEMLAGGMIEETRELLMRGYPPDCPGLNALGYRHVLRHLAGEIPADELREAITRDTRRYAKRQMTWFRKEQRIRWFTSESTEDFEGLAHRIIRTCKFTA